jgi:hypothetical protein
LPGAGDALLFPLFTPLEQAASNKLNVNITHISIENDFFFIQR